MRRPANKRLELGQLRTVEAVKKRVAHLNNMTKLPIKLATPPSEMTMLIKNTTLLVARLKRIKTSKNFQNSGTVGTKPTGL